jgi:hypothetical protein
MTKYNGNNFIIKAKLVHDNRYDYSLVEYVNNKIKIKIICKKHGPFFQTADAHLFNKCGCPKCVNTISKPETQWLNDLNIEEKYRQKIIEIGNKKYKVDAYDPTTNTVYEFNGDFWHGNPNKYDSKEINCITKTTFGELYARTIEKERDLIKTGYHVVSIWESEWNVVKHGYYGI